MTRRSRNLSPLALSMLAVPLLLSGCLYTKGMIEEKFQVQVLEPADGVVTVGNRSGITLVLCTFGEIEIDCPEPDVLESGATRELEYAVAWHRKLKPDYPCSYDDCLTIERGENDLVVENTDYVSIYKVRGLRISLRPHEVRAMVDPVKVTEFVESMDSCYRVVALPKEAEDRQALKLEDHQEGVVFAKVRAEKVPCE